MRIRKLRPYYKKQIKFAHASEELRRCFHRRLVVVSEEFPLLTKSFQTKLFKYYRNCSTDIKEYPKGLLLRESRPISLGSLRFLQGIPEKLAMTIRDNTENRQVIDWFYKNRRPACGWTKRRYPFPTNRRERTICEKIGNIPKFKHISKIHGSFVILPMRKCLAYTEYQYWVKHYWDELKYLLLNQIYLYPTLIKSICISLIGMLPDSLEHTDKDSHSFWYRSAMCEIFYLKRLSLKYEKISSE